MKYIDSEKLIKAIEEKGLDCSFALKMERMDTLALIDELLQEQPDVDLMDDASFTKELKRFLSDTGNEKKRGGVILPIIKHFYSLGFNSRKK